MLKFSNWMRKRKPANDGHLNEASTSGLPPTEAEIRLVCLLSVVLSGLLIAAMLVASSFEKTNGSNSTQSTNSVTGWIAVVGAAIVFGSTGEVLHIQFAQIILFLTVVLFDYLLPLT